VVALATWASAAMLALLAVAVLAGLFPLDGSIRPRVATVLSLAAAVDVRLGFVFFRSSLSP
jgi:hypothetical protein